MTRNKITSGAGLWVVLALSALFPLLAAAGWNGFYAEAAYGQLRRAQAVAAGQGWHVGGYSPLFTLLLALASGLRLPLPSVALALSTAGWMMAVTAWFLVGLAFERPAFSTIAAILLALHPWQGRVLGLEPGLVLGLLGLATWWIARGRARHALVAVLVLAVTQPLALLLILPLLAYSRFRRPSATVRRPFIPSHFLLSIGAACYGLASILAGSWGDPRHAALLLAILQLLAVGGLDELASLAVNKRTSIKTFSILALAALLFWQGSTLAREWRFRPTDRRALYGEIARWLRDHALPGETVAAQRPELLGYLAQRATFPLPDASRPVSDLIAALDGARPDYCVAPNSLAWHGVRTQPWFQARYAEVRQFASPYDSATPLTLFRYTPTPFDDGETISTTATFALDTGGAMVLAGYRVDSPRITPGEPLYVTLYWHVAATVRRSLRSTVRLTDPATGRVWAQVENPTPGGLAATLWHAGARFDDRYVLFAPSDVPAGDYALDVALHLPSGEAIAPAPPATASARFVFARISRPPNVSAVPLTPDHPLTATFGSEIELLGYDVKERIAPGTTLRVALYWRARQPVPLDYKVFVHLLSPEDGDPPLLAQDDGYPVAWQYPSTRWQPGETIRDEHLLAIPLAAPRGNYTLVAGLYDPATGQRPPVHAAGIEIVERRLTLQEIRVR